MLVIDPGTLRLPLRSAGEQCSPLPARYSFCIIPKSNPVPQGIFCLGVMFVQLDLSCRRRRRWRWAVPLALAALLLALPQLAALRPAVLSRVDRVVGRHYMTRLDALQRENFTLHQQLAQSADALAENAALRQLVGCGRGITGVTPARVVARASAVSRWPARTPRREMPSSTRVGGTRGSLPARTATPALWTFPPLPGFAAAMPG